MKQVYRIANARYQSGVIGRGDLLTSQSQCLQQQQAEVSASNHLLQAKIGLIRSLDGGYQAPTAMVQTTKII
ncbi:TolC family protein [Yersinia ruckeri]|nr:TolC family protein [Yersinia ruckeri]ELI6451092.1 TolC family protein [Yersinia ruckeri]ELM3739047.1 TolC family protein [Yersinia ruckeri]